jgi:hypothetical protein
MGIKIQDIAYVRFSAPDLDEMEAFLTEFGMVCVQRSWDALYVRGLDGNARAGHPINDAYATPRLNMLARLSKGPSHAKRLGHCVLNLNNSCESEAWYQSRMQNDRRHEWGVGRHLLGSRSPITGRDPCAYTLEHWTDGDLLDAVCGSCPSTLQDAPRTW